MRHGSLFSGIGGFDLAAEWMGWENVFHCEWNEFGQKVLKYHFPNADSYSDITKTDFTKYADTIDILTGGFPCQPFSLAGKRKGTDDERYLWHEMLRAVQEIKPKFVVAENVYGIVNIDGGLVFEQVCADLEAEGYEVQPFIIPAASKNAPHRRDRVWFVAYCNSRGLERSIKVGRNSIDVERKGEFGNATDTKCEGLERYNRQWEGCTINRSDKGIFVGTKNQLNATDTESRRTGRLRNKEEKTGTRKSNVLFRSKHSVPNWINFPTQSPICGGDDGLPTELDGITFSKWRNESIKAYGNAIVPQVAFTIFNALCTTSSQQ